MRRRIREIHRLLRRHGLHPVLACPAASARPQPQDLAQIQGTGQDGVEFATGRWRCSTGRAGQPDYVKMITSEGLHPPDLLHGHGWDDQNKVNFYDGKIRVVDCNGREVCKFHRAAYRDYVARYHS